MSRKTTNIEVGQPFGQLIVLSEAGRDKHRNKRWKVRCSCGQEKVVGARELRTGDTKSCGCAKVKQAKKMGLANTKHGESWKENKTPEYEAWRAMIARCHNPNHAQYRYWGGRGVKVCQRWKDSFENFLMDVGRKPKGKKKYTLDRIDNNGDYKPGNVRWATWTTQASNRRSRLPHQLRVYMTQRDIDLIKNRAYKEKISLSELTRQLLFSSKFIRK